MPNRPVVGPKAFSTFVQQMRDAYPDLSYELGQVSTPGHTCADVNSTQQPRSIQ